MPRIDVTLDGLRQMRARAARGQPDPADLGIFVGLLDGLIARSDARMARQLAKLDQQRQAGVGEAEAGAKSSDSAATDANASDSHDGGKPSSGDGGNDGTSGPQGPKDEDQKPDGPSGKGHGRNGASAFTNAKEFLHGLKLGIVGTICAACQIGRMLGYRAKVIVRVVGQPLFGAERHVFEQARCRICGAIIQADGMSVVLDGVGTEYVTYHWSACAMLIVMHYFAGAPFKRLEALHRGWRVPMPDANQWRLVDECDDLLAPVYKAIERHAIQNATTLTIDDTGSMIIALRRQIEDEIAALKQLGEPTDEVRTGINATGVYLETEDAKVVLFFTGRHHAGEIIDQLLAHRRSAAQASEKKLVKVTDAASKNFTHAHGDILEEAVCNAHAFLKFRAIKSAFPAEYVIAAETYKTVFDNDDKAKARGLDPVQRMDFHHTHSKPAMEKLWQMCEQKLKSKLVEPHSPLWEPLTFIVNQWERLTKFYQVPGVPLDSNIVEQTLIIPVRYLAGSFSYKTQNGADVGDRHMSLVATANANGVEPVAYLTECLQNHEDLAKRPEYYLPWVYKTRVEAASCGSEQSPSEPGVGPPTSKRKPPDHSSFRPHPLSVPPPIRPSSATPDHSSA